MLDTSLVVAAASTQVILTWYGVHVSVKKNKSTHALVIGLVGLVGIIATSWGAQRSSAELASIRKQLSGAEVRLSGLDWDPDSRSLVAHQDLNLRIAIKVRNGTAKDMKCYFGGFTMPGPPSPEQSSAAISKFKKEIAGEEVVGEDRSKDYTCYREVTFRFDEVQIVDIVPICPNSADCRMLGSVIYAMCRAEWKNDAGADFHYDVYRWMEPPTNRYIGNQGWHDLSR